MVAGKKLSQKPGTIDLGLYYEMNARMVDSLDTYLFFLDDRSRVIETAALSSSLPFEAEEILTFTKELKVPQGIKAISFGYTSRRRWLVEFHRWRRSGDVLRSALKSEILTDLLSLFQRNASRSALRDARSTKAKSRSISPLCCDGW